MSAILAPRYIPHMSHPDTRDNPCSTSHAAARDAAEQALWRMMAFYDTPLADLDRAMAEDPGWVLPHVMKAGLDVYKRQQLPEAAKRLDAYPHQLSGGQRQRVVIAIALACGPDLLIADEPTTALDVTIQREVLDLIQELVREDGMGLLLISHDLGVMADSVQQLMVMYAGTVVESGPTAAVFERLAHPYTRGLFAARPRLGLARGTRLATISGRVPELVDMPAGCPFADRCDLVLDACRATTPPVVEVGARHWARCLRVPPQGTSR